MPQIIMFVAPIMAMQEQHKCPECYLRYRYLRYHAVKAYHYLALANMYLQYNVLHG